MASPVSHHQKKRLRQWLIERLDCNDCPGCFWIDREQKIFRLAWKHYGKPGFDEERVTNYIITVLKFSCPTVNDSFIYEFQKDN